MPSRWRTALGTEMNLAPLLDVIFCLLFFFVLATSIRRERAVLRVDLPQSGQETAVVKDRMLEVVITRENLIFFEGKEMADGAELAKALARARESLAAANAAQVLIRTDGRADVQTFVTVSDACVRAGLKAALMETLRGEKSE